MFRLEIVAVGLFLISPSPGRDLTGPARTEAVVWNGDDHMFPRYQAGYVSLIGEGLASLFVSSASGQRVLNRPLALPDAYRIVIHDIAVGFDGQIAVAASAMDKEGRLTSLVAWLASDGSVGKAVRTAPFGVTGIAFTADGSLWALGRLKEPSLRADVPVHDIVRQYDADGKLVRSVLPRLGFSSSRHPATEAFLVASSNRIALVSATANQWAVVSTQGFVVAEGGMAMPDGSRALRAALTESGRLFLGVMEKSVDGKSYPLYEIDIDGGGGLINVATSSVAPPGEAVGWLLGADRDQLVFLVSVPSTRESKLVWSSPGLQP